MNEKSLISENKGDESFDCKDYKRRILFKSILVKHKVTVHGGKWITSLSLLQCQFYFRVAMKLDKVSMGNTK